MPNGLQRRLASLIALACTVSVPSFAHDRDGEVKNRGGQGQALVIVLENKTLSNTFGTSTQVPYLQKTLVPMGGLLTQYYGTGHVSLDNYISMISGQSPTPDTDDDCLPALFSAQRLQRLNARGSSRRNIRSNQRDSAE